MEKDLNCWRVGLGAPTMMEFEHGREEHISKHCEWSGISQ